MASYFIKIEDAPDVRRRLLESSKASLNSLRIYQQLLVIRGQKLSLITQLRRELKEITLLINHAESMMPVLSEKELEEMAPKKPILKKQDPIVVSKAKMPEVKTIPKKEPSVFIGARKIVDVPSIEVPNVVPKAKPSELQRLEAQLAIVENKLGKLN